MAASKFHEDLSKYEPAVVGNFSWRQIKYLALGVPALIISMAPSFIFNNFIGTILTLIVGSVVFVPVALKFINRWVQMKHRLESKFIKQQRTVVSGQISEYPASKFVLDKNIKEWE